MNKVHHNDVESMPSTSGCHQIPKSDQRDDPSSSKQKGMTLNQVRHAFMQGISQKTPDNSKEKKVEYMAKMKKFIEDNFRKSECSRFVPRPDQEVEQTINLKCKCGEILKGHSFFSSGEPWQGHMSDEVRQLMAQENWEIPPTRNISSLADDWTLRNIETHPSKSFGKINFVNVEHIGRKKSAKFIRLSNEDSVDKTLELMKVHWKMMDENPPHLVISVVGGSENFKLNGKMRETFTKGLMTAAKTTDAWLITSGFNVGVMKSVGQAVQEGQSYFWKDGVAHSLQCIGIAPWGSIKDRQVLEGVNEQNKFTVSIKSSNVIEPGKPLPLNPDHTHFIFVDDGYRNRFRGAAKFRAELEKKIAAPKAAKDLAIPLVMVVVEGGKDAINNVHQSLKHGIPVVICAGTGRAADIIAYAYSRTKAKADRQVMERELERQIFDAYESSFTPNEANVKCNKILEKVKKCCEKAQLITIFDMTEQEDLHQYILSALLNAQSSNPFMAESERESLRLKQLRLALVWNRVDIAQEKIFREDVQWSSGSLDTIMTEAICNDNAEFATLLLQQGVIMMDYLTKERLIKLYEMRPSQKLMERVFSKLIGKDSPSIDDLPNLLKKLLDKYKWGFSEGRFSRPYKELFIWALLYGRRALAKLCWEMGEEPVTSAIAATRIYDSLSHTCSRHELNLKKKFNDYKREFENLAIRVLDACHSVDPDMAMILVERKSPYWDSVTCMEMAASANDQKFISTAACQNSIGTQWRCGIQNHWLVVMMCAYFPIPMVGSRFLKVRGISDDDTTNLGHLDMDKLLLFRLSPIYKFCNSTFWYLAFTTLFTYFILVDFKAYEVTTIEYVCMVTICTYIVDEVVYMILLKKAREWRAIHKWYGILNIFNLLNFILALVGFILHKTASKNLDIKAIYSVNCVIFYVSITKLFITNATLGPKLIMIKKMVEELCLFMLVLVIFLMAYGVARQSVMYRERPIDWDILKDIFYYPYWQLFGDVLVQNSTHTDWECTWKQKNLNKPITPCQTEHWLAPILLACYLMVGHLLLINLIIAIFSHVFTTIEQNSQEIWKFQMYFLSMEYRKKSMFSPPINILVHMWNLFSWAIPRIKRKYTQKMKTIDEVYDTMSYDNLQQFSHVIDYEDIEQYVQLFEKEMMVNILNQKYVKTESM